MNLMITLSLLLNIAVLIPVCIGLIMNTSWAQSSYGVATSGRGILLSVYLAILFASGLLFFLKDVKFVIMLLLLQIVYKLTTPITVKTFQNPVVVSNLVIAVFHAATLLVIWRETNQ